ncbi:hypothetical protein DH2020_040708 [Rehmannia glutinosa]|uniref:Uncharacterized protein n=1 Tax=Rehmannia glutinosa TaxID=99300 RepID=A0ABR0UTW7_REHGL
MGNRSSSPGINLSEVRQEILKWKSRPNWIHDDVEIPWTESHLTAVLDYVLKLEGINSSHFTQRNPNQAWYSSFNRSDSKKFAEMVESFQQKLRQLFNVPKLQQLSDKDKTLKKNELIAAFIIFLVQLWYHRTGSFEGRVDSLKKELRFLVTILGDTPFLGTELEQVQSLLAEFEAVATLAGSLVYCFNFTTDQQFKSVITKIDKALDALFKRIDLLKANITNLIPSITNAGMARKTVSVVDSLFIVESLFYDLEDLLNQDNSLIVDVKDQIRMLHQELIFSRSLLKDIKVNRHSEIEELEEPVVQFKDVAYEAEYLINSFLVGDTPLWYFSIRLSHFIDKIKLIGTGLQEIKMNYDIGALKVTKNLSPQLSLQAKRNNEVNDITVGFEDKEKDILDQLIGGADQLQVISIFGMPGLGKTTLARKIYNHPSVNYRFDKRSWSVISQTYQRKNVLINVLISSISELDKDMILNMEEERLAEHLYKSLMGRRYLIVMDDIWDSNLWDNLLRFFPDDRNGSRILFTSRNKNVAPPNSIIYALPSLSNGQCWELLKKKVFHDEPCPPQLQVIGKKIAANCYGLPLAVVIIAGILSTMDKEEITWKNVGENLESFICDGRNNSMMQILELSYNHLSNHLKPCFLYFGAFPEDKEISVRKLIRLWIAEGFISNERKENADSVAEEYLKELIDKSLVIVSKRRSDDGIKTCVVHDLLRDLCLRVAEEENFLKLMDNNYSIYERHHRLCFHTSQASSQFVRPFFGLHVRSFFGHMLDSTLFVLNMKLLRALDLRISDVNLGAIKFLLHLRYLAINYMPLSIGSLVNLEFLVVKTTRIVDIHPQILKMTKLRYLHLTPLAIFDEKCNSSQINNLEFLSNVSISNLKDEELLKCSPHLRKLKCRCQPFVDNQRRLRYPDLHFLTRLESLKMTTVHGGKAVEINFPSNIKKLTLDGLRLPWEKMSVIGGLPNLEVLKLKYNAIVGETWDTRDDEFQQLRFLKLEILDLHQWNVATSEHFPKLQRLVFRDCYNLQEIPTEIGEIDTLQSIEVESCLKSLAQSARKIEQEQRDMGNEELKVFIGHIFRDGGHKSNDGDSSDDDD